MTNKNPNAIWPVGLESSLLANKKESPPLSSWEKENLYNTRVLVKNWFEDRRHYDIPCSRCTGHSIYRTDFLPHCQDQAKCCPPESYAARAKDEGEGWMFLRNSEDYCSYLQNYTTTYDLMHNWEVRRAGVKTKPLRHWKLIYDSKWMPDMDNAVSFGNLTQYHYRKGPQLPLIPNDWDVYANNKTEYQSEYFRPRFPDAYTLCRYAVPKNISKGTAGMALAKNPIPVDSCTSCSCGNCTCCCNGETRHPNDNDACCCGCYRRNAPRFNDKLTPAHTLKQGKAPIQNLFPAGARGPFSTFKRQPHPKTNPGCPISDSLTLSEAPACCKNTTN